MRRPSAIVRLVSSAGQLDDLAGAKALAPCRRPVPAQRQRPWLAGRNCFTAAATPLSRPPPETGDKHQVHIGQLLHDFEPAGCLPRDDLLIVVGRNHDVPVLLHQFFGLGQPLARRGSDIDDLGPQGDRGCTLDGGRIRGHHDDGFSPHRTGRIGHALRMVAAGVGDDAATDLLRRELQNLVGGAANLEGSDGLQAFGLEPDLFFCPGPATPGNGARTSGVLIAMPAMRAAASRMVSRETKETVDVVMADTSPAQARRSCSAPKGSRALSIVCRRKRPGCY